MAEIKMETRVCKICVIEKSLDEFGRRPDYAKGHDVRCKRCRADEARDYYRQKAVSKPKKRPWQEAETSQTSIANTTRRYYRRHKTKKLAKARAWNQYHPEANKAHRDLNNAIRLGKIVKPTICERCGKLGRLDGHHHDYGKPFEVEWLCRSCHVRQTREEHKSA